MINERMEELASLYALGALDGTELREFETALREDAELQRFVAGLSVSVEALAAAIPRVEPPPRLRAKILAEIAPPQKTVARPERKSRPAFWFPWSFATGLAVLCLFFFAQDRQLQEKISAQSRQIDDLNRLAESLQTATNNLAQAVLALRETNRLANLQVAMLNSLLADAPKVVAVTLWDGSKQEGVFVGRNLKPLPPDRDYQLWVLDNGTTPVDAGVVHAGKDGGVRVEFKTRQPIKVAGKFAVTEEVKGGAAAPTLKNMVLLGG